MNHIINNLFDTFSNKLIANSSTINLILILFAGLTLLLGVLLYCLQSRLIYLPQLPPGSKEEVWLPSRFGYGPPGKLTETEGKEANWEELVIETSDGVKLQAYWIKAPSQWNCANTVDTANIADTADTRDSSVRARRVEKESKDEPVPFTVLYMQANAGNIVNAHNIF